LGHRVSLGDTLRLRRLADVNEFDDRHVQILRETAFIPGGSKEDVAPAV
jgi:hypothetical protein